MKLLSIAVLMVIVLAFAACAPAAEEVVVEEPDTTEADTEASSQVTHLTITGRVVIEDGTPWPGVNLHVAEFKEGECVMLFSEEFGPHAETDRTGMVELVVERAYLEGFENGFCLEVQVPGEIAPDWAVVGAEKDIRGRHRVHISLPWTVTQLEEGVRMAIDAEDIPLVFRVPETGSVMDLGEVYVPVERADLILR